MARGVRISKSIAQAPPIAEYVVVHAMSLLYPIEVQAAAQRDRAWKRTAYREISESRWLLVGYGAIGHQIAQRIKPFGIELTVARRNLAAEPLVDRSITLADLPAALPDADVVVLACALNEETRGLADAAFFASDEARRDPGQHRPRRAGRRGRPARRP